MGTVISPGEGDSSVLSLSVLLLHVCLLLLCRWHLQVPWRWAEVCSAITLVLFLTWRGGFQHWTLRMIPLQVLVLPLCHFGSCLPLIRFRALPFVPNTGVDSEFRGGVYFWLTLLLRMWPFLTPAFWVCDFPLSPHFCVCPTLKFQFISAWFNLDESCSALGWTLWIPGI